MKYRVLVGINFPKPGVLVTPGQPLKDPSKEEQRAEPGETVDLDHLSPAALTFLLECKAVKPVDDTLSEPDQTHAEGGN